jgi:DNA-binding IclR family transcriptional regulator
VLDADERLCLYRENSTNSMRHHLEEGVRLSLRHGAAGHVLAAGILDCAEARDRLRPDGGCVSVGERNPLVVALAVPVPGPEGRPIGALSLSGPKARIDPADHERLIGMLLGTATALGRPEAAP